MRSDKSQALKLRLQGKSYNEITTLLGVPKGTLSDWFTGLVLSPEARSKITKRVHEGSMAGLMRRNKNQTHLARQRMQKNRSDAKKEIQRISRDQLRVLGAALYWAEGYKRSLFKNGRELTHHSVSLTNSDPQLVKMFIRFLTEVCEVPLEDIKADIRIYEHMNTENVMHFWQKTTKIPEKNFGKVYYGISKSSLGKRPFTRLQYGTILIRVNNTNLFHRIMGWIEGLKEQAAMV